MSAQDPEPVIMQRENERSRVVIDGKRIDDGTRCTVVVIHERTGYWGFYPHGFSKFGVRLPRTEAVRMARAILAGAESQRQSDT